MTDASAPQRLAPTTDGGPVGPVMVIGGPEDQLGERVILSRFVELVGGGAVRSGRSNPPPSPRGPGPGPHRHGLRHARRSGRFRVVAAHSPSLIGLGLDEDPAAIVDANDVLEVMGRGWVTIVEGTDVIPGGFQTTGNKPMMVSNARLHSLPAGYRFDLRARRVLPLLVTKNEHIARLAQGRVKKMVRRLEDRKASERAVRAWRRESSATRTPSTS